jgi:5'-nucleotidase/UDP-sugar diphosphatase
MKARDKESAAAVDEKKTFTILSRDEISRREFLASSAAAIAAIYLTGPLFAAADEKKTFTILHTNDMHTSFIGMGPAADYTPFTLNDDGTLGGYARLAALIAKRKAARQGQGPVLVLDAGDYSMGTAFAAATREIGGELKLMGMMGYDATTFGNHEFDLGPDGLGRSISVAAKAGRIPAVLPSNTDFTKEDKTLVDLQRLAKDGVVRRYVVIQRGGIRFGIFGLLGKEAMHYTSGGATTFADPIETAKGEGGSGHLTQPRWRGEREGRALHRRRGRASGQGCAGHRRGDQRPQPHLP